MSFEVASVRKYIALEVARTGYAFIERLHPSVSTEELVRTIGDPLELGRGEAVHDLKPTSAVDAQANSYSATYGLDRFPLHTDLAHWHLPPRYLLLRCVNGFDDVATRIFDGLEHLDETLTATFTRALVQPRRLVRGRRPLLRLYDPVAKMLRWDERYIQAASAAGAHGMVIFRELLATATETNIYLRHSGDTLILDNWRMLHGRSAVPAKSEARVINRVYIGNIKL